MSSFVTIDLNGWLDHLVDEDGEARTLGFRSCLYQHKGIWLFGAQALAAAREARAGKPLIDVIEALAYAAGHGPYPADAEERKALPNALWQIVTNTNQKSDDPTHLALIIPDGRYLGAVKVQKNTGKTALETLYGALERARPAALANSRIELIWRSVAALKAVMNSAVIGDEPGAVLVISVNRRIFWTVLELRHWTNGNSNGGSLHIARRPVMSECNKSESWTAQRTATVRAALADLCACDLKKTHQWTRYLEILATGMSPESLAAFGIDANGIEHRSWPASDGTWSIGPTAPPIHWPKTSLPPELEKRIEQFRNGDEGAPLMIVVDSPAGLEMTVGFEGLLRKAAPGIQICRATGTDAAKAAAQLAQALGRDPDAPAWLDEVPSIELKIRKTANGDAEKTKTEWLPIVPGGEVVRAGETYHTKPHESRHVVLAPGIEHVHLHLRRGEENQWDERYSGQSTGHAIEPSDRVRTVEPLARIRPLSGEARIEIVEHRPNGSVEALAASRTSIQWSEMAKDPPAALCSIPELYVFKASSEGWKGLNPLLQQVISAPSGPISTEIKEKLYKCTNSQWRQNIFPLGSDGQPPQPPSSEEYQTARKLLRDATDRLHSDLERSVCDQKKLRKKAANRLHMPLTWLFTGCPERTVEILLDAINGPEGDVGKTLHMDDEYSAWAIYSGVGRAARSEGVLKTVFDSLIEGWESRGGEQQDKFLLAAVSHPMARRVAVRRVLNESRERFERVKSFLDQHLTNILDGIHDPRAGRRPQPSIELRYVTMGYRGLCQVRYANPDWFAIDGEDAAALSTKLKQAQNIGGPFEQNLLDRTAPYLIGKGEDPTMPGGF